MEWIGTAIAGFVLVSIVGAIIAGRIIARKKGKHSCCGSCAACNGACHS